MQDDVYESLHDNLGTLELDLSQGQPHTWICSLKLQHDDARE